MNRNYISQGMNVIGNNLRYIWDTYGEGRFDELRKEIQKRLESYKLTESDWNSILEGAAKKLGNSTFFYWRKDDAIKIYEHTGNSNLANRLKKEIDRMWEVLSEEITHSTENPFNDHLYWEK